MLHFIFRFIANLFVFHRLISDHESRQRVTTKALVMTGGLRVDQNHHEQSWFRSRSGGRKIKSSQQIIEQIIMDAKEKYEKSV